MLLFVTALMLAAPDCHYDRARLLALDEAAFDQDLTGGWRALEMRGCEAEAADLIRDYRRSGPRRDVGILSWHEGQLRADIGQYRAAISLFKRARRKPADDTIGWNFYVDGSIAFLRGDRMALERARARLARVPPPPDPPVFDINGKTVPVAWPLNLNVLDGFIKCFGRPYREAYSSAACTQQFKIESD